jgi:hypothetical protein
MLPVLLSKLMLPANGLFWDSFNDPAALRRTASMLLEDRASVSAPDAAPSAHPAPMVSIPRCEATDAASCHSACEKPGIVNMPDRRENSSMQAAGGSCSGLAAAPAAAVEQCTAIQSAKW